MAAGKKELTTTDVVDSVLWGVVTALATWTPIFHLATALELPRDLAGVIWLATAGGALMVARALRTTNPNSQPPSHTDNPHAPYTQRRSGVPALVPVSIWGLGIIVFWLSVFTGLRTLSTWLVFWGLIAGAGALATWWATSSPAEFVRQTPPVRRSLPTISIHVLAVLFAVGSAITRRSDADDVFLVNRALWVAQHDGAFATRDTLFAEQVFPATRPDFPTTAFEPFVGLLSAWTRIPTATMFYLVIGPAIAGLSIYAMWRLAASVGARSAVAATWAAAVFLVLDGRSHAGLGNFSFVRSWQGKSVLLLVIMPVMLHAALRWGRQGRARDMWLMILGMSAGLGLSSSAVFLLPVLVILGVVSGTFDDPAARWRRIGAGVIPLLLPFGVAIARLLADAAPLVIEPPVMGFAVWPSPTELVVPPWSQWSKVFGGGAAMGVVAFCVVTAPLAVGRRSGRVMFSLCAVGIFGILYAPGTFDIVNDASGARSILWRSAWLLQVPLAVGAVSTMWAGHLRRRASWGLTVVALVLGLVMVGGNTWVLDDDNVDGFGWPALDLPGTSESSARMILRYAEPGDVVASTRSRNWAVGSLDSRVFTTDPRGRYIGDLRPHPEFHADARLTITRVIDDGLENDTAGDLVAALELLSVDVVCPLAGPAAADVIDVLKPRGWHVVDADDTCVVIRRGSNQ